MTISKKTIDDVVRVIDSRIELAVNTLLKSPDNVSIEALHALMEIRKELKSGAFTATSNRRRKEIDKVKNNEIPIQL